MDDSNIEFDLEYRIKLALCIAERSYPTTPWIIEKMKKDMPGNYDYSKIAMRLVCSIREYYIRVLVDYFGFSITIYYEESDFKPFRTSEDWKAFSKSFSLSPTQDEYGKTNCFYSDIRCKKTLEEKKQILKNVIQKVETTMYYPQIQFVKGDYCCICTCSSYMSIKDAEEEAKAYKPAPPPEPFCFEYDQKTIDQYFSDSYTTEKTKNKFVEFMQGVLGLLTIIVIIWIIIGDFVTTQFRLLDLKMMELGKERIEYNYLEGNYEVINGPYTDNLPHEKHATGIFDNNLTTTWISSKDIIGECIEADFLVPINIKYIDFSLGMDENKENTIYDFPTKLLLVFDDSRYLEFNLEIDYGTDTMVRNWQSACIEIPGGVVCKEMKIYILDHEHLENKLISGKVKKCTITNITPYSDDSGTSIVPDDISGVYWADDVQYLFTKTTSSSISDLVSYVGDVYFVERYDSSGNYVDLQYTMDGVYYADIDKVTGEIYFYFYEPETGTHHFMDRGRYDPETGGFYHRLENEDQELLMDEWYNYDLPSVESIYEYTYFSKID